MRVSRPCAPASQGSGPLSILDFGTGQSVVPEALRADGHRVIAINLVPPVRVHADRLTGLLSAVEIGRDGFDLVYAFRSSSI